MHYAGQMADVDAVNKLAAEHGLAVIEDAAHTLPAFTRSGSAAPWRSVGTTAPITCFSFYANKCITTGEGGMAVTDDDRFAERMRLMSLHGMSKDAWKRYTSAGSWYYEVVAPGFKYNLTDIAAALGLHQLARARGFQQRRAEIAAAYDEAFKGLPLVTPPGPLPGDTHAWHLYVLRLADGALVERNAFIEALFAAGIGCSVHYIPLHQHPYWRERYGLRAEDFPHSQHAYERMLSLPIYTRMSDADVRRVVAAVTGALG
jgi:dTDP-4-amino-4,6-dideoxygalactose transaminase